MAIEFPRSLVEYILLGSASDRRQLQDSPILGDVWIAFARAADESIDLLITPNRTTSAAAVALAISEGLGPRSSKDPNIGYLQGIVAARLDFEDVLRVVVPMTEWWHNERNQKELARYTTGASGVAALNATIGAFLPVVRQWNPADQERPIGRPLGAVDRYLTLAGLILWAREERSRRGRRRREPQLADALRNVRPPAITKLLREVFNRIQADPRRAAVTRRVWQVSLNRTATPAIARSVPAIKADAARTLFAVKCKDIAWAVIDSGIDGTHPAFRDAKGDSRIRGSFDFSQFRQIVSLSNERPALRKNNLEALAKSRKATPLPSDADRTLSELALDIREGRPINWAKVETLVRVNGDEPPLSDHGTHVAGIVGASRMGAESEKPRGAASGTPNGAAGDTPKGAEWVDGICPDIGLYDFRVLAPNLRDTEFAVIAALQYIRYLNARNLYISVHGANLSLSIPHDVRNYACGRTPVCVECERLVESGVIVVAAAGNRGYQSFETKDGAYEGYAAFSVTDPGNADGVITVGATHRYSPHTYGVSFFSSRGPTGDGRPKPDLVAPGERINAPVPDGQWGDHDGTSMAAPHVSGAAAMLMSRYTELIGQPRRVKRILCDSATDLGRERSFQGHGMLDVLRAFQSI
jgi:subtilisin family serine protease